MKEFPANGFCRTWIHTLIRQKLSTVTFPPPGNTNKTHTRFTIADHRGCLNCVGFEEATDSKGSTEFRTGQVPFRWFIYGYGYAVPSRVWK